jgi:hypothetical protein
LLRGGIEEAVTDGYNPRIGATMRTKQYTVSDGKLVLVLNEAEEGGYVVTSPLDPELITEAETVAQAFENARDALKALRGARVKLWRRLSRSTG